MPPQAHVGDLERDWVLKLVPTLNQVLPFGENKRLAWEQAVVSRQGQHLGASTVLHTLLQKGDRQLEPEEALCAANALNVCTDTFPSLSTTCDAATLRLHLPPNKGYLIHAAPRRQEPFKMLNKG